MKRLEILKNSLSKKETSFDAALSTHLDDVRSANGQPLNDKGSKGRAALNRWEKQDNALRAKKDGIERTKAAIEREEHKIAVAERAYSGFPKFIQEMIDAGTLTIWRKHPNYLFVTGVEKARIKWGDGKLCASYFQGLPPEQYAIFRDVFNSMNKKLRECAG